MSIAHDAIKYPRIITDIIYIYIYNYSQKKKKNDKY